MLMQLPLHDIYLFIGFPVLIGLGLNTYNNYKKTKNQSSLYVAVGSMFLASSLFFTIAPTIFTHDPKNIGYFAFIADISQSLFLYTIWLFAIKITLRTKQYWKVVGYLVTTSFLVASITEAAIRNLNPPYGVTITNLSAISYDIVITETPVYRLLLGLEYFSMILVGIYYWRNSFTAKNSTQKLRIRALSVAFIFGPFLCIGLPDVPIKPYINIKDIGVSIIYLIIGLSLLIGHIANRRNTTNKT